LSLSTHYSLPPNLFELYATSSDQLIPPLHTLSDGSPGTWTTSRRELIETEPASHIGYDEILSRNKQYKGDKPSSLLKAKDAAGLMKELRWANLGLVYQWSTKCYDFSQEEQIPFPMTLKALCTSIVADVPWDDVLTPEEKDEIEGWTQWKEDYEPDTGIVNFYQTGDTLMGHVDRSELDPSRPLVSISLGHAAVFLLGGTSRSLPPRPIILRSGDVLIMSGRARQFYHGKFSMGPAHGESTDYPSLLGVPRIMEDTLPAHFAPSDLDDLTMAAAKRWIQNGRININARQVFPPGFQRPK
ncbi:hypothetical protein P7C73_g6819, partial [Tremellales sp. Uapishka_1]